MRDARRRYGRASRGFSLIEMLVALAITGFVSATLTHLGFSLLRLGRAAHDRVASHDRLAGALRVVGTLVGGVAIGRETSRPGSILGNARHMTIRASGLPILGLSEPTLFRLETVQRPADRVDVVLSWTEPAGAVRRELLAADLRRFDLNYRGRGAAEWRPDWEGPVGALELVQADLVGPTGVHVAAIFEVSPILTRTCVVRPLDLGCPSW